MLAYILRELSTETLISTSFLIKVFELLLLTDLLIYAKQYRYTRMICLNLRKFMYSRKMRSVYRNAYITDTHITSDIHQCKVIQV